MLQLARCDFKSRSIISECVDCQSSVQTQKFCYIIPMSFRPKISPSPFFPNFFTEGLEIPQRKIPPLEKGDEGDLNFSGCHRLEFFNEFLRQDTRKTLN